MGAPADDVLDAGIRGETKLTDQVTTPTVAETADEVAPAAPLEEKAAETPATTDTPVQE